MLEIQILFETQSLHVTILALLHDPLVIRATHRPAARRSTVIACVFKCLLPSSTLSRNSVDEINGINGIRLCQNGFNTPDERSHFSRAFFSRLFFHRYLWQAHGVPPYALVLLQKEPANDSAVYEYRLFERCPDNDKGLSRESALLYACEVSIH